MVHHAASSAEGVIWKVGYRAHEGHGVEIGLVVRRAGGADLGPLDLPPNHPLGEQRPSPEEELVVVGPRIPAVSNALEVVEVELSTEGGELGLLEELAHDLLLELARAVNHEGAAMRQPGDNVLLSELLGNLEHDVEFYGEGPAHGILFVEPECVLIAGGEVLNDIVRAVAVRVLDVLSPVSLGSEPRFAVLVFRWWWRRSHHGCLSTVLDESRSSWCRCKGYSKWHLVVVWY